MHIQQNTAYAKGVKSLKQLFKGADWIGARKKKHDNLNNLDAVTRPFLLPPAVNWFKVSFSDLKGAALLFKKCTFTTHHVSFTVALSFGTLTVVVEARREEGTLLNVCSVGDFCMPTIPIQAVKTGNISPDLRRVLSFNLPSRRNRFGAGGALSVSKRACLGREPKLKARAEGAETAESRSASVLQGSCDKTCDGVEVTDGEG